MGSEIPICVCKTPSAISLRQVQQGMNLQIDAVIAFPDRGISTTVGIFITSELQRRNTSYFK